MATIGTAQHTASEWPEVLKRMQTNMHTMRYAPPSADNLMQIQFYLQNGAQHSSEKNIAAPATHAPTLHAHMLQSSLALGPFLLLAVIGLLRWFYRHRHPTHDNALQDKTLTPSPASGRGPGRG